MKVTSAFVTGIVGVLLICQSTILGDDTKSATLATDSDSSNICVVLIGGVDSDPSPDQIAGTAVRGTGKSGLYQLANDLNRDGYTTEYFNWNGTRAGLSQQKPPFSSAIIKCLRDVHSKKPQGKLVIVGNSWGGHTAWDVCRTLSNEEIPISLVLFLDPSSAGRIKTVRPETLPSSIKKARNYYTRNVFGWREWPGEDRLINIDLGNPDSGFLIKGGPKYDSPLDPHAHIAAEWDERIHKELLDQIKLLKDNSPMH